jgi:hypothetical protein
MAIKWNEITEDRYDYYLGVVPPAIFVANGFMVGEASDHDDTGRPRYQACITVDGQFYAATIPMTVREFKEIKPEDVRANIVA